MEHRAHEPPIIVAVDGSRRDADALRLARLLRGVLGAPIVLAHAHPYGQLENALGESDHGRLLRAVGERVWDHVAEAADDAEVTMRLLSDSSPARALHELARAEEAALIVAGASERGRVGLIRPGSTSERIVQGSPCPVAVAPAGYGRDAPEPLGLVGCGYDGEPAAATALAEAAAVARAAGARLRLITVDEPMTSARLSPWQQTLANQEARAEAERRLAAAAAGLEGVEADTLLLEGDAAEVLSEQSDELDVLFVGSRGYGPVRSLLLGGVSGHLIRAATCPVVVCPPA